MELLEGYNKRINRLTTTIQKIKRRNKTKEEAKTLQEKCKLLPAIPKELRRELGDLNTAIGELDGIHRRKQPTKL